MTAPANMPPDPGFDPREWFGVANPATIPVPDGKPAQQRPHIREDERRDIRSQALLSATYIVPEIDELADADSDGKFTERVLEIAKRFEMFIVDGL